MWGTRAEHLAVVKRRATHELEWGGPQEAMASVYSDLMAHPELANHPAIQQSFSAMLNGAYRTADEVREFINNLE